jgi:hypothetical protein
MICRFEEAIKDQIRAKVQDWSNAVSNVLNHKAGRQPGGDASSGLVGSDNLDGDEVEVLCCCRCWTVRF